MRLAVAPAVLAACVACADGRLTVLDKSLSVDPTTITFADTYVGGVRQVNVDIRSDGTGRVSLDVPALEGDIAAFEVTRAPDGLAAGASATVTIRFAPVERGIASATLRFTSDAENGPVEIALLGVALAPLDCDDENQCTDEVFDAQAGVCLRTNSTGECNDGSACTSNDRCSAGECVGSSVTCADALSCTTDVCDPSVGCQFIANNGLCNDGDPCTLDRCSPTAAFGTGCAASPAPDGSPCGGFEQCVTVDICLSQLCVAVDIPDGIPCNDGNACTSDDLCADNECVGTLNETDATVVAESTRVFGRDTPAFIPGHAIFADRSLHVVSLETLEPVAHLRDALFEHAGVQPFVDPSGTRVALNDPVSGRITIVDVTVPTAPFISHTANVSFIGTQPPQFIGFDDAYAFLCSFGALWRVAWFDAIEAQILTDEEGHCGGNSRVSPVGIGLSVGFGVGQLTDFIVLDESGAHIASHVDPVANEVLVPVAFDTVTPRIVLVSLFPSPLTLTGRVLLVDIADPMRPSFTDLALPDDFVPAHEGAALNGNLLYLSNHDEVVRFDIASLPTATRDGWRVVGDHEVLAADEAHVMLETLPGALQVASASGVEEVQATDVVHGFGGVESLIALGGPDVIALSRSGWFRVDDVDPTATTPRVRIGVATFAPGASAAAIDGAATLLLRTDGAARGLAQEGAWLDEFFVTAGALTPVAAGRRGDEPRRFGDAIGGANDDWLVFDDVDGTATAAEGTLALAGRDSLRAVALEGCNGIGVAHCVGGCDLEPAAVVLSACTSEADIAVTSVIPLSLGPVSDVVSATHHGTQATFLGTSSAALHDFATGTTIEAPLPELNGAKFASAGYEAGLWLIVATYGDGDRAARAVLFDTSLGEASLRASFDVGEPAIDATAPIDVARRVLGIVDARAYISDWDPTGPASFGHRVIVVDLALSPPQVVDELALASEPVDMVLRPNGLVIGRIDGISHVTPSCAP